MEKGLARELLKFVNDNWVMQDLSLYAHHRIEFLRKQLEVETDANEIFKIQGSIKELRRVFHLRDEVLSKAE